MSDRKKGKKITKKFDLRTATIEELEQKIAELKAAQMPVVKKAKGGSLNEAIARVKKEQGFRNGGTVSLGNFKGSF
tara:strand:+ start:70 stop:297 length:228 start_codon:yes stop_codon:yes gene_type:complete